MPGAAAEPAKGPLILTEVPPRAWHPTGTDLFTLEVSEYLVVADYYAKYPFVTQQSKCATEIQRVGDSKGSKVR